MCYFLLIPSADTSVHKVVGPLKQLFDSSQVWRIEVGNHDYNLGTMYWVWFMLGMVEYAIYI